jgi:predicted RNase H-like nuclease
MAVPADDGARVLGIDGCRAGWVGIVLAPSAAATGVFGASIGALLDAAGAVDVVGIDMPIHPAERDPRPADVAARLHLRGKASSVFPTPARSVLEAGSYADACAAARRLNGKAVSRQAWALSRKILEVDAFVSSAPDWAERVYEVHPEVSFSLLAGAPIRPRKTSWAGLCVRRAALAGAGVVVPDDIGEGGRLAAADDVLDAAAVAWTARRIAAGEARTFPDPPPVLPDGRVPAIWA